MSTYDELVLADGPVAYYPMNDTGATLTAAAGGLNGTYTASPATTTLPNGDGARVFDGSSQYAEVADDNRFSLTTTGVLTIEAWIRPDVLEFPNDESTGYVHWLAKGATSQHEWAMRMYSATTTDIPPRPNRISGYVFNLSGAEGSGSYFQDTVTAGQWIHVASVHNVRDLSPANPTGYTRIHKNGVFRDQDRLDEFSVIPANGTAPLRIASRSSSSYFLGAIAKVAIYNYAVPASHLAAHYRAMTLGGAAPRLVRASVNGGSSTVAVLGVAPWRTIRGGNPARTEVLNLSTGEWLATFTDGASTVTLAGAPRTFTQSDVPIVDHFTRTRTAEWGPAAFGGKWSQGGGIDADFNVSSGVGTMACTDENVSRRMRVGDYDLQNQDVTVKFKTDKAPAGAGQVAAIMLGYLDLNNFYQCEVTLSSTSSNVLAQLRKRVAGTVTTVVAQATVSGLAHSVGAWFWIRAQSLTDGTLRMKVWADGTSEPGAWSLSGTDTTFLAGRTGVRSICNTGTSNLPVTFSWDDFTATGAVVNPPTVTHSTWVRVLPTPFDGVVSSSWLSAALADTSPDVLAVAMQYIPGAAAVMGEPGQIGGDADYGPLSASGSRVEGADFNDYLGIPWTYTGVDNPEAAEFRCLDCSGYMRMVWGYRLGLPLSLSATGSGRLPRVSRDQIDSGPGVFIVPRAGSQITDLSPLRVGDIVGFDATAEPGELDGEIDHLGIYLGQDSNGDYRFISSRKTPSGPSFSDTGGPSVLNGSNLYARTLRAVRRF